MKENKKNTISNEVGTDTVNYAEIIANQQKQIEQLMEVNKTQKDAADNMINALKSDLDNIKTNSEQENKLLGLKIEAITNKDNTVQENNPYDKNLIYKVYNQQAKAETIMTGDEVGCIVGIDEHITTKLQLGDKEFEKYPYKVELVEQKK